MSYDSWKLASPDDQPEVEMVCKECNELIEDQIRGKDICMPCLVSLEEPCTSEKAARRYVDIYGGTIEQSEDYPHEPISQLVDRDGELVRYIVE